MLCIVQNLFKNAQGCIYYLGYLYIGHCVELTFSRASWVDFVSRDRITNQKELVAYTLKRGTFQHVPSVNIRMRS